MAYYTSIDHTLNHLVRLESTRGLHSSTISQIQALKLELEFLRTFLRWIVKRCPGDENLLLDIQVVTRNAGRYLQPLQSDRVKDMEADLARLVPNVLENIKPLKPKIEQVHVTVAKSSPSVRSTAPMEEVEKFLNSVVENLDDLLSYRDSSSTHPAREEIQALETKLRLLRNLLRFVATRCSENEKLKDLSTHAEAVAIEAAYLSFMCSFDPINGDIKEKISQLLWKIAPTTPETRGIYVGVIQALRPSTEESQIADAELVSFIDTLREYLTGLLNDQPSWIKFEIEVLHDELIFLSSFVKDPPMQSIENGKWKDPIDEAINDLQKNLTSWGTFDAYPSRPYPELLKLKGRLIRIEDLAVKVGYAIFSYFYLKELEEDMPEEVRNAVEDLLGKIKQIKEDVQIPLLTLPDVNMTRTDDLGFIKSLSRNLRELLDRQAGPVASLKRQIEGMVDELEVLNSFLKDCGERCHKDDQLENHTTHIMRVAHVAEYVIDSFLVRDGPLWYHSLCLAHVVGKMKRIRTEVKGFDVKVNYDTELKIVDSIVPTGDMRAYGDYEMVGLEDVLESLLSQLLRGPNELNVVPIVGMGGIGKTTLAIKIYNDMHIVSHFDVRAYVCVSQVYDTDKLTLAILHQVTGQKDTFNGKDVGRLREKLHQSLMGKRFLILIDDLWDTEVWDDLRMLLPVNENRSRVLLTTRSNEVASYVAGTYICHLQFLTHEESWRLLRERIFRGEPCSPALEQVGRKLVEQCGGLPLMIVLIAGILARMERRVESWKQVLMHSSQISKDESLVRIIGLSYQNLPDYLRQCFIYFGAFPLDEEIQVSKLIRLWTAERFAQQTKKERSEDVAMGYLRDLIERNLVMVCRISSVGEVKACKIHNSFHGFCLDKAKHSNFFQLMEGYKDSNIPTPAMTCEHRRLCISSNWESHISSNVSGSLVRSLVLTGRSSKFSRVFCDDFSFLYENFKLLRVLDLACINVGNDFPVGLEKMTLLRYLAVRGEMTSIPSSIVSLQQLETFVTIGLSGEIAIPDTIWNLTNLRHLHIDDRASFGTLEYRQESSKMFPNLRTMSTPFLSYGEDSMKLLRRSESLEELKCIFLESWDSSRKKNMFPRLDFLQHLHSLKLFYYGRKREFCEFNFPSTLRRLTLSRFCLPWDQLSVIGALPNLEILKLLNKAFEGSVWEMTDVQFFRLKILKLDMLNLEEWNATEEAFPLLERLELQKCNKLNEIPTAFADIFTLKVIEVKWCSPSVEDSAVKIKEYMEEMTGEDILKVIIYKS